MTLRQCRDPQVFICTSKLVNCLGFGYFLRVSGNSTEVSVRNEACWSDSVEDAANKSKSSLSLLKSDPSGFLWNYSRI